TPTAEASTRIPSGTHFLGSLIFLLRIVRGSRGSFSRLDRLPLLAGRRPEVRHNPSGEQLLLLDRLPVFEAARVHGDGYLGQAFADVDHVLNALDDLVRGPDPDDVALDHLVV